MKKYQVLLFDLDDTLLDFQKNEYEALGALFQRLNHPLTDEIRRLYHGINQDMWRAYERGELEREVLLNTRFARLFEALGEQVDGPMAEGIYREELGKGAFLIDGALEVCTALSRRYPICIATNGVGRTQRQRLTDSGWRRWCPRCLCRRRSAAPSRASPSSAMCLTIWRGFPPRTCCWWAIPSARTSGAESTAAWTPAGTTPRAGKAERQRPPMRFPT